MVIEFDTAQIAGAIGFAVGIGTAAAAGWARLRRLTGPVRELLDWLTEFRADWSGVPDRPGVPGRPGVMVRLGGLEARQAGVEAELRTNGGASLKDAVRRTETAVAGIQAQLDGAHLIALSAPAQPAGGATTAKGEAA